MAERTTFPALARPFWVVDWQSIDRDQGHQIDWDSVGEEFRETRGGKVTVGAAGALAAATTVPVDALTFAMPAGTILYFGGEKIAVLSAAADEGDTSLTVDALPNALVANDTANVTGSGQKTIQGGTEMTVLSSGKMIPFVSDGGSDAHGFLIATATEGSKVAAKTGHGLVIGGALWENLLPEAVGSPKELPSGHKTALDGNTKGFVFRSYSDSRAS